MRLPFVHLERIHDPRPSYSRPLVDLVLDEPRGGGQPLGDLIAPAAISIEPDQLILDGQFARVLALVGLPPVVDVGWLEPLVASTLPTEVALYVARATSDRSPRTSRAATSACSRASSAMLSTDAWPTRRSQRVRTRSPSCGMRWRAARRCPSSLLCMCWCELGHGWNWTA
jgi:hypothetical protein